MEQQTDQVQRDVRGMLSSVQLLEAWAKTDNSIKLRYHMLAAVEDEDYEDSRFVDGLLDKLQYDSWKSLLGLHNAAWLYLVSLRHQ